MAIEHLMVATPIFETEVGTEYQSLPPHMTVFPWFDLPENNWPRFDQAMRKITEESEQPVVCGGARALFGPEGDVSVRLLNRAAPRVDLSQVVKVHTDTLRAVRRYGDNYDPSYVGSHWQPHITDKVDFQLDEGQRILLPELVVFKQEKHINGIAKVVKAIYKWEEHPNE